MPQLQERIVTRMELAYHALYLPIAEPRMEVKSQTNLPVTPGLESADLARPTRNALKKLLIAVPMEAATIAMPLETDAEPWMVPKEVLMTTKPIAIPSLVFA